MTPAISTAPPDWLLLQLADSAFPTGGFAHSAGLEAAYQHKEVRSREDLLHFLDAALSQSAHGSIPFVSAAHREPECFDRFDHHFDAFTTNHVANRASRAQGRAFLATCERAFPHCKFTPAPGDAQPEDLPLHYPVVFGAVLRRLQVDRLTTLRLFLFNQLRSCVSSAVRLNIVGPIEAQALQHQLAPVAEHYLTSCADLDLAGAAQTSPLLELFQGTQDRLYSRLFQS